MNMNEHLRNKRKDLEKKRWYTFKITSKSAVYYD